MSRELDEARSLLREGTNINHRKELVRARSLAKQIVASSGAVDGNRVEALEIVCDTWKVEMRALNGAGDLYDHAFREALAAQREVLTAVTAIYDETSVELADALFDLADLYIEHGHMLSGTDKRAVREWRERARVELAHALRLYEQLGDEERSQEVRDVMEASS